MKGTILAAVVMVWSAAANAAEPVDSIAGTTAADARGWMSSMRPAVEIETFGGQKHLSRGAFRALDEQNEVGLRAVVSRRGDDAVSLVVGVLESRAERRGSDYHIAARTRETGVGLRARLQGRYAESYVSAGLALVETEIAAAYPLRTWDQRASGGGVWYAIGMRVPVGSRVTAGAEMRQTIGAVYGAEHSSRANGFHVGATLGFRFGKTGGRS